MTRKRQGGERPPRRELVIPMPSWRGWRPRVSRVVTSPPVASPDQTTSGGTSTVTVWPHAREVGDAELASIFRRYQSLPPAFELDPQETPSAEWAAIANAPSASERCSLALALWDPAASLLSTFLSYLPEVLEDVRVANQHGMNGLLYVVRRLPGEPSEVFFGTSPTKGGGPVPEFYEAFPEGLKTLRESIHGEWGYVRDGSRGIWAAENMKNLGHGEWGILDADGVPVGVLPLERTIPVLFNGGATYLCVSPDLPGKGILWTAQESPRVEPFFDALDVMMFIGIELY